MEQEKKIGYRNNRSNIKHEKELKNPSRDTEDGAFGYLNPPSSASPYTSKCESPAEPLLLLFRVAIELFDDWRKRQQRVAFFS